MGLLVSSPFARDLARLLAGWVAAIVFVQAMAAALGMVQGPRHVHVRGGADAARTSVFVHAAGRDAVAAHLHDAGHDAEHDAEHDDHGGWARHVHASPTPGEATLGDDAQELGAAAGLVLASMVAVGPGGAGFPAADAGHVMHALPAWSCITHVVPLPDRPPRA